MRIWAQRDRKNVNVDNWDDGNLGRIRCWKGRLQTLGTTREERLNNLQMKVAKLKRVEAIL